MEGASYIETAEENLYNYLSGLTRTGNGKWLLEQNIFYLCDFFVVFIVAKKVGYDLQLSRHKKDLKRKGDGQNSFGAQQNL